MKNVVLSLSIVLFVLLGLAGRECEAVIYQYMDEKGNPALVDDLQKVPEQYRPSVRMVSGEVTTERTEEERLRDAKTVTLRQEAIAQDRAAAQERAESSRQRRFVLSGSIAAGIILILVIMANLDVLKQYSRITGRVRTILIALLIISLGIIHVRDVLGLFEKASDGLQTIQEKQAAKGRKAAEFYKAVDQMTDQKVQDASRQTQENQSEERH